MLLKLWNRAFQNLDSRLSALGSRSIYMDHAAATPTRSEAHEAMHAVEHLYGNPGGMHQHSVEAKKVYEQARADIAKVLAVKPQNIVVASSATEANNLAILGVLRAMRDSRQQTLDNRQSHARPHIITTAIEHGSVLEVLRSKEVADMCDVTYLQPEADGHIAVQTLQEALRPETVLVSIGWANGEIGTVQPMRALVRAVREYEERHSQELSSYDSQRKRIVVHTDAGQAMFAHSPQPQGIGVDMVTMGSGKLYGPRGVAILYKANNVQLAPIMYGGHQEGGLRPGTEDIMPLVGFAKALQLLDAERKAEFTRSYKYLNSLKILFLTLLHESIPTAVHNGTSKDSLPHIVNISIPNIDSEYVMLALDHTGVSISTKSVCVESTGEPVSHVVQALVADDPSQQWRASTTLRFSFGRCTIESDIRYAVKALAEIVGKHKK